MSRMKEMFIEPFGTTWRRFNPHTLMELAADLPDLTPDSVLQVALKARQEYPTLAALATALSDEMWDYGVTHSQATVDALAGIVAESTGTGWRFNREYALTDAWDIADLAA